MTVDDVREAVWRLRQLAGDDEVAHSGEDTLRHRVLKAIADGHPDPKGLAAAALETSAIEFERWRA